MWSYYWSPTRSLELASPPSRSPDQALAIRAIIPGLSLTVSLSLARAFNALKDSVDGVEKMHQARAKERETVNDNPGRCLNIKSHHPSLQCDYQ